MALNFGAVSSSSSLHQQRPLISPKHKHALKRHYSFSPSRFKIVSLSETTENRLDQDIIVIINQDPTSSGTFSSARMQIDLLERLTSTAHTSFVDGYESSSSRPTIREQLANLIGECYGDFSIPLGENRKKVVTAKSLTKSQKRNIKREAYMNKVSQRNDWFFLATIGAFFIVPPLVILGIAIATGYVQLLP